MKVRTKLIALRNEKKLSQDSVAKAAGISRAYYTMIENGTKNPSPKVAQKIAQLLGFKWTIFFES